MGLLTPLDIGIFIGSLVVVMGLGLWAGRKEDTSDDYFLAGHTSRWWGVAGSIFGSNVSANHIIGMMGVGFSFGFAQSHFEITAIAGLLLLCYGFLPVYRKLNVYTLSEYLGRRYGESSRILYALIMLLVIVVIQMVPGFYIGSRALNTLLKTGKTATAAAVVGTAGDETGKIVAVEIKDAGRGYAEDPLVEIAPPPGNSVNGRAKAKATFTIVEDDDPNSGERGEKYGALTKIEVTDSGSGYDPDFPPEVEILGGADFDSKLNPGDVDPRWYLYGILLMAVVTGTYTVIGGLKAVIITDVLQSILMLGAALLVGILIFRQPEIGGWTGMLALDAKAAGGRDIVHLYLPTNHPELPATGVLSGLMVLHFYYWGTNQFIVQRALSARSDQEARLGIITAGFFKLLIPFMSIGGGIAAYYFFREKGLLGQVDQDAAFLELMRHIVAPLGYGIVGLVFAGVVGAILSSVDSMLNSGATIVTFDVYKRYINPDASERALVWMGRLWVVIFIVAAASLTIFTMDPNSEKSFFLQIASHQSKLVAGVVVAFALGIFWKRATALAATLAIVVGVVASYGLPVLYSGYSDGFKVMQGYTGSVQVQKVESTNLIAPRNFYDDGDAVRFYQAKALPAAASGAAITTAQTYYVHAVDDQTITLHRSEAEARDGANAIQFTAAGEGTQFLYFARHAPTVSWWGVNLNFMHSVFLAAMMAFVLHVVVSLLSPRPSEEKSRLTWTGLGGHDPATIRKTGWKLLASLGLFALLGWVTARGELAPLWAGLIAGIWTWLMFLDVAIVAVIRSQVLSDKSAGEVKGHTLLEEDRFWAGLLAGLAVFMMYYFF